MGHTAWAALPEATIFEARKAEEAEDFAEHRRWGPVYLRGDIPGVRRKPITVLNHIDGAPATAESAKRYRWKTREDQEEGGAADERDWYHLFPMRGIQYLITKWPTPDIRYDMKVDYISSMDGSICLHVGQMVHTVRLLVSTIPMPVFWRLTKHGHDFDHLFRWAPVHMWAEPQGFFGHHVRRNLDLQSQDIYCNYISDATRVEYRHTWRDGFIHVESLIDRVEGIERPPDRTLYPGKIWTPESDEFREMVQLARSMGIHFVGRYGSWDQSEVLHQTYEKALNIRKEIGLV